MRWGSIRWDLYKYSTYQNSMVGPCSRPFRMEMMMDQIRFKSGEFQTFTATRSFALGNFNVRIEKATELDFDGSTVRYAGADYAFPQLRGALTAGWVVPAESFDAEQDYDKPVAARIQVRSATQGDRPKTMVATVEADEHIVMNSGEHATTTKRGNRRTASAAGSEGVPVRTLKTSAVSTTQITDGKAAISDLDRIKITPGQGITRDEMLERMDPEAREAYRLKTEAARAGYPQAKAAQKAKQASSRKVVGRVKRGAKGSSEDAAVSTGGGLETWDGGEAEVVAQIGSSETAETVDGVTFGTSAVKPAKKPDPRGFGPMTPEVRRRIAETMCPDFPANYDFGAPAKKKLARLQADFEDRADILLAAFAAEDEEVKARLLQEFPDAFV